MPIVANDWWPPFSDGEYAARHARVRVAMAAEGLDCLVVYGRTTLPGTGPGAQNMAYLANYGPAYDGYVVFPLEGEPTLFTFPPVHVPNARKLSCVADVRSGPDLIGAVVERLGELSPRPRRIGLVGNTASVGRSSWTLPHEHHERLARARPDASLRDVTRWFELLRLRKSEEEIAYLCRGAAITDAGLAALRARAAAGVTHGELHNAALAAVHAEGGRTVLGHVGSTPMDDPRLDYPDFYATGERLQRGHALLTEVAATYGAYGGKLLATFFLGAPTAAYRDMFERAAEVYRSLRERVGPGVRGGDLEPLLSLAPGAPYGSLSFVDGWSTYNTPPSLHWVPISEEDRRFELFPGLSLTLAGWVRSDDGPRGVWVGKTVLVTEDGCEELEALPVDDLDYAVLA